MLGLSGQSLGWKQSRLCYKPRLRCYMRPKNPSKRPPCVLAIFDLCILFFDSPSSSAQAMLISTIAASVEDQDLPLLHEILVGVLTDANDPKPMAYLKTLCFSAEDLSLDKLEQFFKVHVQYVTDIIASQQPVFISLMKGSFHSNELLFSGNVAIARSSVCAIGVPSIQC